MAGARLTFHLVAKRGHVHHCLHGTRIHIAHRRRKKIIHLRVMQKAGVALQITGISAEVFIRAKLQWVDEDRHQRHIVFHARAAHKLQMALMEITHGRHEADLFALLPGRRKRLAQFLDGVDDLHGVLLPAE